MTGGRREYDTNIARLDELPRFCGLLGEEDTVPLLNRNPVTRKLVIRGEPGCVFGTHTDCF